MTIIERLLAGFADIFTVIASSIAIYLAIWQRDKISAAFKTLINYSTQMTLTELISKIERLNDLQADSDDGNTMAINILSEIEGQIKGNSKLTKQFPEVLREIDKFTSQKTRITEAKKRGTVALLREKIRSYDVDLKNS